MFTLPFDPAHPSTIVSKEIASASGNDTTSQTNQTNNAVSDLSHLNWLKIKSIVGCEIKMTVNIGWSLLMWATRDLKHKTTVYMQSILILDVAEGKPNHWAPYNCGWYNCIEVTNDFQLMDICYGSVYINSVITW